MTETRRDVLCSICSDPEVTPVKSEGGFAGPHEDERKLVKPFCT